VICSLVSGDLSLFRNLMAASERTAGQVSTGIASGSIDAILLVGASKQHRTTHHRRIADRS
jgi:hypothetical protein